MQPIYAVQYVVIESCRRSALPLLFFLDAQCTKRQTEFGQQGELSFHNYGIAYKAVMNVCMILEHVNFEIRIAGRKKVTSFMNCFYTCIQGPSVYCPKPCAGHFPFVEI